MLIRIRGLVADRTATAATEFALIFPLMFLMFVGMMEITQAVRVYARFVSATQTLANLIAMQPAGVAYHMADMVAGAGQVFQPYATSANFSCVASSVTYSSTSNSAALDWTASCPNALTTFGNPVTLANGTGANNGMASTAGQSVIIVQAHYTFSVFSFRVPPMFTVGSFQLPTTYTLNWTAYATPRALQDLPDCQPDTSTTGAHVCTLSTIM